VRVAVKRYTSSGVARPATVRSETRSPSIAMALVQTDDRFNRYTRKKAFDHHLVALTIASIVVPTSEASIPMTFASFEPSRGDPVPPVWRVCVLQPCAPRPAPLGDDPDFTAGLFARGFLLALLSSPVFIAAPGIRD